MFFPDFFGKKRFIINGFNIAINQVKALLEEEMATRVRIALSFCMTIA